MLRPTIAIAVLVGCGAPPERPPPSRPDPLDAVVADLCDKRVVLLGETGDHGSGATQALKGALAMRLIDECGFDSVLFESGIYDFLAGPKTRAELEAAIGGLWAHPEASTSWIPGLLDRVTRRGVVVAGLGGQVSATAKYARTELPSLLSERPSGGRETACRAALERYMRWDYDEANPYSDAVRGELARCVDGAIGGFVAGSPKWVMARSFGATLEPRFDFNARDRLLFENFRWHRARLGASSKSIVWVATVHAAKGFRQIPGLDELVPLGSLVHAELGDRAAAIGFSAHAGSWARGDKPPTPIPVAAPGTLEQVAAPTGDFRYLDRAALARLGPIAARPLSHDKVVTADWSQVLDGLIVIHQERPPRR